MAEPRERADVAVFAEVGAIAQLAAGRLERALPAGLSAASFAVLAYLARRAGPENPLALARAVLVTKAAMTNTLQRLHALGLIAITADPDDARRKRVTITQAGQRAHRDGLAASRPRLEALRATFGAPEFEAALPFLRRLRVWLEMDR